ncbi:MAG: M24 family metallopeptidase [Candidatus Magasanikiibacteriota bacterium]
MWTKKQIKQHFEAGEKLGLIKNEVADFIRNNKNINELLVQKFVLKRMKECGMKMDKMKPIVAFGKNTSNVHYFVSRKSNRKLKPDTLILLDIWARLNQPKAPYADMTWMFYYGKKTPAKLEQLFKKVLIARDLALRKMKHNLKSKLPVVGKEMNELVRKYFGKLEKNLKHSLGHSLGTLSPHGIYVGFHRRDKKPIVNELAYTIEPGLYFANRYGFRSEIDVFVEKNGGIVITTPVQRKIERIYK